MKVFFIICIYSRKSSRVSRDSRFSLLFNERITKMYLTGFADEAAGDIDGQIRATKELGWKYIEARNIGGKNIHDISDEDFDIVCEKLAEERRRDKLLRLSNRELGEADNGTVRHIARRSETRHPADETARHETHPHHEFRRAERPRTDDQMEEERFRRLRELTKMFLDEGLMPVHENCMNYGGMGWKYTLKAARKCPGTETGL